MSGLRHPMSSIVDLSSKCFSGWAACTGAGEQWLPSMAPHDRLWSAVPGILAASAVRDGAADDAETGSGRCWPPSWLSPCTGSLLRQWVLAKLLGACLSDCMPSSAAWCSWQLPVSLSCLPAAGTAWRCMPELACWLIQTASGRCWLRYCLPPRTVPQSMSFGDPGLNHTP